MVVVVVVVMVQSVADPRFKLLPFSSEITHRKATDATVALMEQISELTSSNFSKTASQPLQPASSVPVNDVPTLQTLASVASSVSPAPSDASSSTLLLHQQLVAYASEPVIDRSECPLMWWAENRRRYPLVSEVARRLLVVPATAISTDRLYTKKGDKIMDKRDTMSLERANEVLFIMENL